MTATDAKSLLLAFLKDYRAWVERGAPDVDPFWRAYGLCQALTYWYKDTICLDQHHDIRRLLLQLLSNKTYPFGEQDYHRRRDDGTQHECPKRLAFVRKTIAELEKEISA